VDSQMSVESVDALPLAARGATLKREFRLIDLPRLSEWANDENARASLSVQFHLVDERVSVAGNASATLRLVCQRCLEPVQLQVEDEFHVVLVTTEKEMEQLPPEQDAVVANISRFEPSWLLEEQLLLAMPLVPLHDEQGECLASKAQTTGERDKTAFSPQSGVQETQRPFADLQTLLSKSSKKRST
jgi:uncharacterized protein